MPLPELHSWGTRGAIWTGILALRLLSRCPHGHGYDFRSASLTKVVGTTTAALGLLGEGVFHLQSELGDLLEDVPGTKQGSWAAASQPYLRFGRHRTPLSEGEGARRCDRADSPLAFRVRDWQPGRLLLFGVYFARRIMERFTKRALDHLVTERVLTPSDA